MYLPEMRRIVPTIEWPIVALGCAWLRIGAPDGTMEAMHSCHQCGLRFDASDVFCAEDGTRLIASDDVLLGEMVGSYRVVRLVGEGAMGRVYLGLHPEIGSRVAIKVLTDKAWVQRESTQRFFAEAHSVNMIHHDGIVNILDLSHLPDGRPLIIMEYLSGRTLSAYIGEGPILLDTGAAIVLEILDALQAAHDAGVVHRDLKPDNVFISPSGHAKLLDFGIAKLMPNYQASFLGPETRTGALLGTPRYMAPEQITGGKITESTDLYAVGAILYEVLTKTSAFDGGSLFGLFNRIVSEPPIPPATYRSELVGPYQDLILRALSKDPDQRFSSARAMSDALRIAMASVATTDENASRQPGDESSMAFGETLSLSVAGKRSSDIEPMPNEKWSRSESFEHKSVSLDSNPIALELTLNLKSRYTLRRVVPALLLVAGSAAIVFLIKSGKTNHSSEASRRSTEDETGGAGQRIHMPPSFNPKSFDAVAYLPSARKLAGKIYPDAYLVGFDVPAVSPVGTTDLTRGRQEATYNFLSPSHSARTLPIGMEDERPCWIYVEVDKGGTTARVVSSDECKGRPRPNPKCNLRDVWTLAFSLGAPKAGAVANIDYLWDGWFFNIDALGVTESILDTCK